MHGTNLTLSKIFWAQGHYLTGKIIHVMICMCTPAHTNVCHLVVIDKCRSVPMCVHPVKGPTRQLMSWELGCMMRTIGCVGRCRPTGFFNDQHTQCYSTPWAGNGHRMYKSTHAPSLFQCAGTDHSSLPPRMGYSPSESKHHRWIIPNGCVSSSHVNPVLIWTKVKIFNASLSLTATSTKRPIPDLYLYHWTCV